MMPYKRPAADKSGVPVYQPNATTYQQLMQLQQPFVPVSCEYSAPPAPPPAASSSSASPVTANTDMTTAPLPPQLPPSTPQVVKDDEVSSAASSITAMAPPGTIPDAATLAKEVAQQNYAKAVKLAAAGQSYAAATAVANSQLSALNPLNYTGVALNKQSIGLQSLGATVQRYPTLSPLTMGAAASFNPMAMNPYAAAISQQNLMNMAARPSSGALISPYAALMRPQYPGVVTTAPQLLTQNYLSPVVSVASTPTAMTNVPPPTHIAAAAAQNNNNTVMQPYKKLKTA